MTLDVEGPASTGLNDFPNTLSLLYKILNLVKLFTFPVVKYCYVVINQ